MGEGMVGHSFENIGFISFIGTVQAFIGFLFDLLGRLSQNQCFCRNH
jgi:hypothetical protein